MFEEQPSFRQMMGQFPTGVTVVSAMHNEQPHGLTVSSFTSLSLDPPLVLVCIDKRVLMHQLLQETGIFCINILAIHQQLLSNHFAGRMKNDWSKVEYTLSSQGLPCIMGALATIECRLIQVMPGGDHSIFIGQVEKGTTSPAKPLVYFCSQYRELADTPKGN